MDSPGRRLDSWKEIAEYLARDRTTVMRWERTAALPVRRVQGGRGRSVFAYTADIDRWLLEQPVPPDDSSHPDPPTPEAAAPGVAISARLQWAAGGLLFLASWLAVLAWGPSPALASASIVGEQLVAFDAGGRAIWRHLLPHVDGGFVPARMLVTDVDADGRSDLVAAVHAVPRGGEGYGRVMLFDSDGTIRWERTLDDRYRFGSEEYGPTWYPNDITVFRTGGAVRIAASYHHQTWWPSVVATYDADGRVLGRFVNAGWVQSLNMTRDGRYLLAAGISNTFGGAMLAVLDPARPFGSSPADGGSLSPCANCPNGAPVAYYVAPWTALARPSDTPAVLAQPTPSGDIEWQAMQRAPADGKAPAVIVHLSSGLDVVRSAVNNYFVETRAALERSGEVLPAATSWREPPVRQWTPQAGWRDAR